MPARTLHLLQHKDLPSGGIGLDCIAGAAALATGRLRLFSQREAELGSPPAWHRNPLSGELAPADRHWSEMGEFTYGDIKGIWEASRFGWAFTLARECRRTDDRRHADLFWAWFADWTDRNPPNLGPNWMCGQEASFRLMAVIFAAEVCGVPDSQRDRLARFVLVTGRRVAANLDYALTQKNNHGISECAGLITAALLLPEVPEAGRWLKRGLEALSRQLDELVYADGSFSQHSLIYHRVLLHDLCWTAARLRMAGKPTPGWLEAAGRRALDFLMVITDPATGHAPLFGANDGAQVLHLTEGEFLDMRPTIQGAAAVFRGELPLPAGPWDEAAAWLAGPLTRMPRASWPNPPVLWHAPDGGYLQFVRGNDRLFMRCPTVFRHRPSQADMLHVDVRLSGQSVACDGGSFSYNSTDRFTTLTNAAFHNVLTVEGAEPLRKVGRFLYLPWPHGESGHTSDGEGWQASHDGYAGVGVSWFREVRPTAQGWRVVDRVRCDQPKALRWHWRLVDTAWTLNENACRSAVAALRWGGPAGVYAKLVRADERTAYGWWSPCYAAAQPAVSLILDLPGITATEMTMDFMRPDA